MKLVAVVELDVLHAIKSPHEVQMPVATTILAVSDEVQAVCLLLLH